MLRKMVAIAALAAASVIGPATAAVAEPYSPKIPTETLIEVTVQGPGQPVIIHVSASANYPTPPEGDIAVQLNAASSTAVGGRSVSAAPLLTTTVHFVDDPVRINGPALPRGRYIGTAQFTPDDGNLFLPSDDTTAFRIGVGAGPGGGPNGGGLPDTGGPNMMWLLLGSGLVVAGAGSVAYGRRRATVPA